MPRLRRLPPARLTEPDRPPSEQNVISFSLWGTAPFYGYGAMINLVLSRTIYPGWTCRFYVDADGAGRLRRLSRRQRRRRAARSKTNIPASACFSVSW